STSRGGRYVAWRAGTRCIPPHSAVWEAAVAELKGKRLNAPDAESMTERWARECTVVRLTPETVSTALPDTSLAAVPLPTGATTRKPAPAALPRLLLKRRGKR
ncbi:hypothetical protein ACFWJY_41705, partial [Streptomyces anulatus]